jgi:hypothetical protein
LININPHARPACHERVSARGEVTIMKAGWKIFWFGVVVFAVCFGAGRLLVGDVVPVGYAEEPQASWKVLTAFGLRSIELTAEWVAAIALVLMLGVHVKAWLRRLGEATPNPIRPAD